MTASQSLSPMTILQIQSRPGLGPKAARHPRPRWFPGAAVGLLIAASAFSQNTPVRLEVDATDAPRRILRARLHIPARPGELTLLYPKWIPGEHGPSGPVTDLTGLKMSAGETPLAWRRDPEDMYAFHLEVPNGATNVSVALDYLCPSRDDSFSSGASVTEQLAVISWNQLLLYPEGAKAADLQFITRLRLPPGWKFGTALPLAGESAGGIEFSPASLETLVDSPLIAGAYFRTLDLTPGAAPSHRIHIVADSAEALDMKPEDRRHFARLVAETGALFGTRHYRSYHFLLTLSDQVTHFGLEHHESSDNRAPEAMLTDDDVFKLWAGLLPHEIVHSWNGKYRRPADIATPDFQQPMKTELLWVYEGLTTYLGDVLTARAGFWTNAVFHENLALDAARLDVQPGRTWRPLSDTAVAAQLLYYARREGSAWRRSVDFYPEGALIWLEADVLIRQHSKGRRSLDDFCRTFFDGKSGAPRVIPYSYDNLLTALNDITPFAWREFFQTRVYETNSHAPLGGIETAGWRLVYKDTLSDTLKSIESANKITDLSFSLGLTLNDEGAIRDVIPGSPADKAGIAPAMKLLAVNGRRWSKPILRAAVKATTTNAAPIELLLENGDFIKTCRLDYHGGERYPHLERDASTPDLLSQILNPLTPAPAPGNN